MQSSWYLAEFEWTALWRGVGLSVPGPCRNAYAYCLCENQATACSLFMSVLMPLALCFVLEYLSAGSLLSILAN